MFDIGWSELVVIGVVALVVIGPKDLPGALRSLGKAIGTIRRMASDFQGQFNEALKEAELDELRQQVADLKRMATEPVLLPDLPSIARDEIRDAIEAGPAEASDAEAPVAELPAPEPAPELSTPELAAASTPDADTGAMPTIPEPEVPPPSEPAEAQPPGRAIPTPLQGPET